jgi:3',5'-cyclic AMP phosphodiesterase CpdA
MMPDQNANAGRESFDYEHGKLPSVNGMISPMTGPRVIHISDLHVTDLRRTWDWDDQGPVRDTQDSRAKIRNIFTFLTKEKTRSSLGTKVVVITGDLTDRGDSTGYRMMKMNFIQRLRAKGFQVFAVPGNHDYCWEGVLLFGKIFKGITGKRRTALGALPRQALMAHLAKKIPGFHEFPKEYRDELIALIRSGKTAFFESNNARRKRFISEITPEYSQYPKYPHIVSLENGYLVLLDSMQGELDETNGDWWAQGKLGDSQLSALETWLGEKQSEREAGKKIVVCLHHSPFEEKDSHYLRDSDRFLRIVRNRIDCLLFGHSTPPGVFQQPRPTGEDGDFHEKETGIPLINVENLEKMNWLEGIGRHRRHLTYPVTVLDLGSYRRLVFQTDGS